MSFALFLSYLAIALVRPIELFQLEFGEGRPIFILWALTFVSSIGAALARRESAAKPAHLLLLAALTFVIALSHIKSGWLGGAQLSLAHFSTSAGLFILICLNATSFRRLKITIYVTVASIAVVAALGVYAYHTGFYADRLVLGQQSGFDIDTSQFQDPDGEFGESGSRTIVPARDVSGLILWRIRGLGFLNDPNDLAQAMVLALPLIWSALRPGASMRNALLVWFPGTVLLYAIYLTHSRGALIGIASLFFFGLQRRLGTARTSLVLGSFGALAALSGFGGGRDFSAGEESAGDRISAWYAGMQMLKAYPVLGVGYGMFTEHHHLTAHNSYLLCLAELGLVGYFFWMGLIVLTYLGLKQVMDRQPATSDSYRLAELTRSALIGFLTCAFFLSRSYQPTLYLTLGLGVATWYCAMASASGTGTRALAVPAWMKPTLTASVTMLVTIYLFVFVNTSLR